LSLQASGQRHRRRSRGPTLRRWHAGGTL